VKSLIDTIASHGGYGVYIRKEEFEAAFPSLVSEWDKWLDAQRDPGTYESYKERDQSVLPYINGKPQWVTEVFLPAFLCTKALTLTGVAT
jgi:hypothetical protein